MPIEKVTISQKQTKLFEEKLSIKLNSKNKLYQLDNQQKQCRIYMWIPYKM